MAIGYLLIQARTAHGAIPLNGVKIRITDGQGNSVYELTTNENGETQKVPLNTVDKSFSLNPYFTGTPYISYNVLAQAAGFNSLYITEIPILDGETATLPLALVPMQPLQHRPLQTKITIGRPAAAMPDARKQKSDTSEYLTYTVQSGDSLWLIAKRYETTADAIKNLNGLPGDLLRIGQVLRIPGR